MSQKRYYRRALLSKPQENNMEWKDANFHLPTDDQTVFVSNCYVRDMLPVKAYYDRDLREFIAIECLFLCPLSVTHWLEIFSLPEELRRKRENIDRIPKKYDI